VLFSDTSRPQKYFMSRSPLLMVMDKPIYSGNGLHF
jgi:hypothetical protein